VKLFAGLIDRLAHAPSADIKVALIADYLRRASDPDRGTALSMLAGDKDFRLLSGAMVRQLGASRIDPVLFNMSLDFVGDVAETKALLWPERASNHAVPRLHQIAEVLANTPRGERVDQVEQWLDTLDATERWALIKLVTGNLGVGVPPALSRASVAAFGGVEIGEIEEIWNSLERPFTPLFEWLEGRGPRPSIANTANFTPLMRAAPLNAETSRRLDPDGFALEWKCDGVRVQLSAQGGERRLYTNLGDDISDAFPEIIEAMGFEASLDGVLAVRGEGKTGTVDDLRHRLGRKPGSASRLERYPVQVQLFDLLFEGGEDLRGLPLDERRRRLEALFAREGPRHTDLSERVPFQDEKDLAKCHAMCRERGVRGLMLKRRDSPYAAGRASGDWLKWNRDPLIIEAVLMYARSGGSGRSSKNTEVTLGAWRDSAAGLELVPIARTSLDGGVEGGGGFDQWVRGHTVKRYGPVNEVEPLLVIEAAFDGIVRSKRHKAGLVLRDPTVRRVLWDKSAAAAGRLETLEQFKN
jgi:DNA ligase 1